MSADPPDRVPPPEGNAAVAGPAPGPRQARTLRVLHARPGGDDHERLKRHLARHAPHIAIDAPADLHAALSSLPEAPGTPAGFDVLLIDLAKEGDERLEQARAILANRATDLPIVAVIDPGDDRVAAWARRLGTTEIVPRSPGYLERLPVALENAFHRAELGREQATLLVSERLLRSLIDNATALIWVKDGAGRFVVINDGFERAIGRPRDEILGRTVFELFAPDIAAQYDRNDRDIAATGESRQVEERLPGPGEERFLLSTRFALRDEAGQVGAIGAICTDITQARRGERELRESETRFRHIADSIEEVFWVTDARSTQVAYVSPAFERVWGVPAADCIASPRLWLEAVHPEDLPAVKHRLGMLAIGEPQDSEYRIVRPDGSIRWIHDRGYPQADSTGAIAYVTGVAIDVTDRRVSRERIEQYASQLESSMLHTVEAVSAMVEMRDPYTAGHQRRVGEIAAEIATEMGLDEHTVKGIRLAGYVHDIGKISIPAEFLSKPRALTPTEYRLVQTHSRAGYEILKSVDFPWPVAQTMLQHHERLDGSGYPMGLKGEEILIEARIMAVADTVEAMASHRPYRAGLGIDRALEEVENQSGRLFDAAVVAACLRLFREKGYAIPK